MRILHILRAPIGGLFRHVCDLVQVQAGFGHEVGVACDSDGGGDMARQVLTELAEHCTLGVHRIAMPRMPGPGDVQPIRQVGRIIKAALPHIVHGHGAKGGLYARLAAGMGGTKAIYTPHGGALHYSWTSLQGAVFLSAEKLLLQMTAGLSFVCDYERTAFEQKIGLRNVQTAVVHNGLWPHEFEPVGTHSDATDLLFVGELRMLKGVDVLIDAVCLLNDKRAVNLTIVGDGPDRSVFEQQIKRMGLSEQVIFTGALPARDAFALGKIIIVPSRAESFPYIVLEAIAAGLPIIATRAGGIPEILPASMLIEANDYKALASAVEDALEDPKNLAAVARTEAEKAADHLSVHEMGSKIINFYDCVLGATNAHDAR